MQFIKHFLFLIPVIIIASCSPGTNGFSVNGKVKNMPEQTVLLEELRINDEVVIIDSTKSDNSGSFTLKGSAPEAGIYRLIFADNNSIILSLDKGPVTVNADWSKIYEYTVTNSPASESMSGFISRIRGYEIDLNTLYEVVKIMHEKGNDSLGQKAGAELADVNKSMTQFIETYADTTVFEPNALFAVNLLNKQNVLAYFRTFLSNLPTRFPNTQLTKDFLAKYVQLAEEQPGTATDNGSSEVAPDFSLPTPDGKEISLSSFRGKYVLIDFWASWCAPCRRENPNVVAAYKTFKGKNFEILGVSLDSKKENWLDAIHSDGIEWTQVSDLKGWENAAAQLYHIQSIPSNVLLDPQGKIIATDLRGEDLINTLQHTLVQ